MQHLAPLSSCPLFRACTPPLTGELIGVLVGLLWATAAWIWLLQLVGLGKR